MPHITPDALTEEERLILADAADMLGRTVAEIAEMALEKAARSRERRQRRRAQIIQLRLDRAAKAAQ